MENAEASAFAKTIGKMARQGDRRRAASDAPKTSVYDAVQPPDISLPEYLARWVMYVQTDPATAVCAALYIDRAMARSDRLRVDSHTVHRVIFGAMVVATKLREDCPFSNQHYADVGGVCLAEANRIELAFLTDLGWDLYVSEESYLSALEVLMGHQSPAPRPRRSWWCGRERGVPASPRRATPTSPATSRSSGQPTATPSSQADSTVGPESVPLSGVTTPASSNATGSFPGPSSARSTDASSLGCRSPSEVIGHIIPAILRTPVFAACALFGVPAPRTTDEQRSVLGGDATPLPL